MIGTARSKFLMLFAGLAAITANAQDTVSVYFEFGTSSLTEQEVTRLQSMVRMFDVQNLDSIQVMGIADTIGNARSNQRLSLKRARTVEKELNFLKAEHGIQLKSYAIGERADGVATNNRRADLVLFMREPQHPDTASAAWVPDSTEVAQEQCYYVDFSLIHKSNVRMI